MKKMEINEKKIFLCCRMCLSMGSPNEMETFTETTYVCDQKLDELVQHLFNIKVHNFTTKIQ